MQSICILRLFLFHYFSQLKLYPITHSSSQALRVTLFLPHVEACVEVNLSVLLYVNLARIKHHTSPKSAHDQVLSLGRVLYIALFIVRCPCQSLVLSICDTLPCACCDLAKLLGAVKLLKTHVLLSKFGHFEQVVIDATHYALVGLWRLNRWVNELDVALIVVQVPQLWRLNQCGELQVSIFLCQGVISLPQRVVALETISSQEVA